MAFNNTAQKGSAILVQKGATTIGGFRTRSLTIDSEIVDVTTADDTNRWRQLLAAVGVKKLSFSGAGIVKDSQAQQQAVTDAIAQTIDAYTLTWPGIGVFVGNFQLNQFQSGGDYNGELTYNISLESAGDIAFTPEG